MISPVRLRSQRRGILLAICVAILLGTGLPEYAWGQAPVGKIAPSFTRADLSGRKVSLSEYRGKIVLLNFWATWCGPCIGELPALDRWQEQFGSKGLQVIGISMDDSIAPVRAAISKYKIKYPVVMGDEHVGMAYGGVLGVPETFLIDRKGVVVRQYEGPLDIRRVEGDLRSLMASGS